MTKHRMETEKKLLQICEFVHFFCFFLGCQFIFLNSGLCYRYKIMLSAETSLTLIYEAFYFSGKSPQKVKVRIFFLRLLCYLTKMLALLPFGLPQNTLYVPSDA